MLNSDGRNRNIQLNKRVKGIYVYRIAETHIHDTQRTLRYHHELFTFIVYQKLIRNTEAILFQTNNLL